MVEFPLEGEWAAVHTPAHRVPSHGTWLWAQAYAYDFVRFHPGGRRFHRRSHLRHLTLGVELVDFDGFGAPVRSAFDGTVVRTDDTQVDTQPVRLWRDLAGVLRNAVRPKGWPEPWAITGNHVVVRHGTLADCYAVFAHLRHGSVPVAAGEVVTTGDVIGAVGHTGNSTTPHLHFQLMTTDDPTTAEAIPCAFRRYEVRRDGEWKIEHDRIPRRNELIRSSSGP
jgi:murein DD-endopeptidase MepM/ murein hydrolase activator NlpD